MWCNWISTTHSLVPRLALPTTMYFQWRDEFLGLVTNWHFSSSFHFCFIAFTLVITVPSLQSNYKLTLLVIHSTFLLCFRLARTSKAHVFSPIRSQHNAKNYNRRPVLTEDKTTRLSNCPARRQDQRPPPGLVSRRDRSSANSPRRHPPRCPPGCSTPICKAKDHQTKQ